MSEALTAERRAEIIRLTAKLFALSGALARGNAGARKEAEDVRQAAGAIEDLLGALSEVGRAEHVERVNDLLAETARRLADERNGAIAMARTVSAEADRAVQAERERDLLAETARRLTWVARHGQQLVGDLRAARRSASEATSLVADRTVHLRQAELERDLLAETAQRVTGQRDAALVFARKIIACSQDGYNVDGGDVQDWAVEAGLLIPVEMAAPCTADGEGCRCAEFGFPATCYRSAARAKAVGKIDG